MDTLKNLYFKSHSIVSLYDHIRKLIGFTYQCILRNVLCCEATKIFINSRLFGYLVETKSQLICILKHLSTDNYNLLIRVMLLRMSITIWLIVDTFQKIRTFTGNDVILSIICREAEDFRVHFIRSQFQLHTFIIQWCLRIFFNRCIFQFELH